MNRTVATFLAALGCGAIALAAQEAPAPGRFRVTPTVGMIRFDKTSALSDLDAGKLWVSAGLSGSYLVTGGLRLGAYLEYQQPQTNSDYYPYALFRTSGDYQLYGVTQIVSALSFGIDASYTIGTGRLGPYLRGGIGRHAVYADVQSQNTTSHIGGTQFLAGGGINYAVTDAIGIRAELLDFMWSDWDRDALNPVDPAYQNTTFPEDNPPGINESKPGLIHNLRLALGFSFTPSGGGSR
jgi:hypothetical protein